MVVYAECGVVGIVVNGVVGYGVVLIVGGMVVATLKTNKIKSQS